MTSKSQVRCKVIEQHYSIKILSVVGKLRFFIIFSYGAPCLNFIVHEYKNDFGIDNLFGGFYCTILYFQKLGNIAGYWC